MARKRTPARLRLCVNGHTLTGEKYERVGWLFHCPSWPALAELHNGLDDASDLIEAFTARACGIADVPPRVSVEVLATNPPCVIFRSVA